MVRVLSFACGAALMLIMAGCGGSPEVAAELSQPPAHSSSMALSSDGRQLFVANPESDSISIIDTNQRSLQREILMASAAPSPDSNSGAFTPAVMPRSVALSPDGKTLYVSGERSGLLYALDVASAAIRATTAVGSEPIGVIVSRDGNDVFVACSQDATIVRVDAKTLVVDASVSVPSAPWALGWSGDSAQLLATHFMGPGVTSINPQSMIVQGSWTIPDTAPRGDRRLAHGQVRGLYDLASRPGTTEIWTAHALLATDTAQPALDFESTAFPALSLLDDEAYAQTLSTDAQDVPGIDGAFGDVVSGPHAIAFTRDGEYVLMADANSDDVLVVRRAQPGRRAIGASFARQHAGRHRARARRATRLPGRARQHRRYSSEARSLERDAACRARRSTYRAAHKRPDACNAAPRPATVQFGEQCRFPHHDRPLDRVRDMPHGRS